MKPFLCLIIVFLFALPALAQDEGPTATPTPTLIPVPGQQMFDGLATANAGVSTISGDLSAPNGVPIVPQADGRELWGYAKWLISPATTDELFGPFAPIFISLGIWLGMSITLAVIYTTLYIGSLFVRVIISIFRLIGQNIYITIIVVIVVIIGLVIAFVASQITAVQNFLNQIGAFFQSVAAWFAEAIHKILHFLGLSQ